MVLAVGIIISLNLMSREYRINYTCFDPHCSAIAFAMPGKVLDLSFALFGQGGILCIRASRHSTTSVGIKSGRFLSHRQVAFVSQCQNCQGWIICVGFCHLLLIIQIGFSIAIFSIGAFASFIKNSIALHCLPSFIFSGNQRDQETARSVHGGCAIIISYLPLYASTIASPCICHSGCHQDDSSRSQ